MPILQQGICSSQVWLLTLVRFAGVLLGMYVAEGSGDEHVPNDTESSYSLDRIPAVCAPRDAIRNADNRA